MYNYDDKDTCWNNIKDPDGNIRNHSSDDERKFKIMIDLENETIVSDDILFLKALRTKCFFEDSISKMVSWTLENKEWLEE